jgi:ABC-type amino acid transport substrate-binding protein
LIVSAAICMRRLFLLLCCLVLVAPFASAAPLRVAMAGAPPFVMTSKSGEPAGFAIELWQSLETANGWSTEGIRKFATMDEALAAVSCGECDVLVGNTSITSEREKIVEFSQPYYRSGLQIMVSEQRGHIARFFERLFVPEHMKVLGGVLLGVLIATIAVAAFERRHNPDFPKTRGAGFAEAFYYVMGLVTGKSSYKGRLVLVAWMLASLFVVAYVNGVLISSMTADLVLGRIHGPGDLRNHLIGLVGGSQSEAYAQAENLDYVAYPDLDTAVAALVRDKVACLIGDAPVLEYYDFTHPRIPIHEEGPIFQPVNYGFAMPQNSPLQEAINVELLHLIEAHYFEQLGAKYFGASYQK